MIGKEDSRVIRGTLSSVTEHDLPHERLNASEIRRRFGGVFHVQDDDIGVYELDAGYLVPENCVRSYIDIALANGSELRFSEGMTSYSESIDGLITVQTSKGSYRCRKLVIFIAKKR
jgi:sarcosine oxidase